MSISLFGNNKFIGNNKFKEDLAAQAGASFVDTDNRGGTSRARRRSCCDLEVAILAFTTFTKRLLT